MKFLPRSGGSRMESVLCRPLSSAAWLLPSFSCYEFCEPRPNRWTGTIRRPYFSTSNRQAALKEDPRYFPSTRTGFWQRTAHAVTHTVMVQNDHNRRVFSVGRVTGTLGGSFIFQGVASRTPANDGSCSAQCGAFPGYRSRAGMYCESSGLRLRRLFARGNNVRPQSRNPSSNTGTRTTSALEDQP